MKKFTTLILIFSLLIGCSERKTYLSDDIRNFIPYNENQELTFVSDKNVNNIFKIIKIRDKIFTDGIGANKGERISVYASRTVDSIIDKNHMSILSGKAQYRNKEEKITFEMEFTSGGMSHSVPLSVLKKREITSLITRFNEYRDVIKLEFDFNPEPREWQITEFYWSLANGYVKLVQHDGTIWELKSINSR